MKRVAFWLYQVYVWLVFAPIGFLLTFITGWVTVLVAWLASPRIASRYVAANWGRLICWLTPVRVSVDGAVNADASKSYVVVCNHQSQYDIFLVYGWLKLDLKWVLKAELRKVPGVGIGCEKAGHIFVDRSNPDQYGFRLGTLDSDPGAKVTLHYMVDSKAPWVEICDSLDQEPGSDGPFPRNQSA